jgi:hypothetical protein
VVIAEAGCKARIVTSHQICETALGQYLRMMAQGSLKRFPPVASVLRGDKVAAIKEAMVGRRAGRLVCSADLTAATDFLHQDAAILMVQTVFKTWGLSDDLLSRIPTLLGPHEVHDPDGVWINRRGILMGGPLSWFTLCLMNTFCAMVRPLSFHQAVRDVRVCGDDLIAYFSKAQFEEYVARCSSVGFHVDRNKTFISPQAGIFTEVRFQLHFNTHQESEPFPPLGGTPSSLSIRTIGAAKPIGIIPAKLFRLSDSGPVCWHTIGPALTAALEILPIDEQKLLHRRVRRLVGMVRPNLAHDLYRAGIDAAAPRSLGGGALPWLDRFTRKTRKMASILASKDLPLKALRDGDGELLLAGDLGGAYALEASAPGADLIRSCALGDIPASRITYKPEVMPPVIGRWADIVRDAEALHGRQLREWGVVPPLVGDPLSLSITRVSKELKRRMAKLLTVYPGAPLSSHVYESLQKSFKLDDVWALPYNDQLTVIHDAGSRKERTVPCGADVQCNRRVYRRLLPDFYQIRGTGLPRSMD